MSTEKPPYLVQFAHGILTSPDNPTTTFSDPLPSFNPLPDQLPVNPFAGTPVDPETEVETPEGDLPGEAPESDLPPEGGAPATDVPETPNGDASNVADGQAADASGDSTASEAPASEAPAEEPAATTLKTSKAK